MEYLDVSKRGLKMSDILFELIDPELGILSPGHRFLLDENVKPLAVAENESILKASIYNLLSPFT